MTDEIMASNIAALRSAIDAASSKQEANYQALRAELSVISRDTSEIRSDIKGLDTRVGTVEKDVAFMKGQRSGGNTMYSMLLAAVGAFAGAGSVIIGVAMMGK